MAINNVLISMSSIPTRTGYLKATLQSLQQHQTLPVHIYIPKNFERFPRYDVKDFLQKIKSITRQFSNVEIITVETDLGPLTKMAYCVTDKYVKDVFQRVVFLDDDLIYPPQFLTQFTGPSSACITQSGNSISTFTPYQTRSHLAYGMQAKYKGLSYRLSRLQYMCFNSSNKPSPWSKSGFTQLIEGWSGVSVDPNWFDDDLLEIPREIMNADDVWISGYLENKKIGIFIPANTDLPKDNGSSEINGLKGERSISSRPEHVYKLAVDICRKRWKIWPDHRAAEASAG